MACYAVCGGGADVGAVHDVKAGTGGLDKATIAALATTLGENGAGYSGHRFGFAYIRPQYCRATVAILRGRNVNARAGCHGDGGGLLHRIRVVNHAVRCVGAALPIPTHQYLATASGAG